ncbi:VQ motif protein [Medicago truncatula]|uniref:VQ motif protein n=1 Tax=Medicago truncatula TaxID=3880 RepID=G7KIB1_MEDTR|nr:VQ motif protein [Medicago truncatula]
MASGGCSNSKKPVKIVIVTTEYVETDAMSFKSVVQKLTGKHSFEDHVVDEETEAHKVKRQRYNVDDGRSTFFISDSLFNEYDMLNSREDAAKRPLFV